MILPLSRRASPVAASAQPMILQTSPKVRGTNFRTTQASSLSAQCASARGHILQLPVKPSSRGMADTAPSPNELTNLSMLRSQIGKSAPAGRETPALPSMQRCMSVPDVGLTPTASSVALVLKKHWLRTPYKADAWEQELQRAGLLDQFHKMPNGFRHGFNLNLPHVSSIQSPPNNDSINTHLEQFNTIIDNEINKGRYLGPFPLNEIETALGPFQSSPLSLIPKPGCPGKLRLIQNFSFPIKPC